jgi:chondroitin-sulfate-ABC endolyase/exolyase
MKHNTQGTNKGACPLAKYLIAAFLLTLPICVSAAIYSFETTSVPTEFSGNVQLSTAKYKLGTQSLQWDWTANANLTVANPSGLTAASQNSNGGITLWIYNAAPVNQSLTFNFQNAAGQQKCTFAFKLNFKGWRCLWARFAGDMKHDRSQLAKMIIQAPNAGIGKIYFDYLEFLTNVSWERMSDDQYTVVASDELDNFVTTRNSNPTTFATTPNEEQRQGLLTIANRLDAWFMPSTEYANNTYLKQRTTAFNSYVTRGRNKISSLDLTTAPDGTVTGPGLFPQYSATTIDGTTTTRFRDINENYLIQLAYDYRKNNATNSRDAVLKIFDWMYDQGWADGSALGTLRFERLRSAGYFYALFLMRNYLGTERLNRELSTIKWLSLNGTCFQTHFYKGENTDDVRTLHIARLIHALSQSDENAKLTYIQAFTQSLSNSFDVAHGYLDVFKPDGSGYHHRGVYYSSYYPEALYSACLMYYLLHDTPFALSNDIYERLKQALLTFRFIAAEYDVPVSTSGRFPEGNTALDILLPAFSYLVLSQPTPDEELTAAFKKLWKPDVDPLKYRINRATTAITFQSTIGEIESMVRVAALTIPAEAPQTGILYQPFAGLMVAKTPQWLLSIKGMSKYIWDYEASASENPYGRYLSNGHLEWTNLQTGQKSFNGTVDGWDWSRIPGTTYKKLSATELHFSQTSKHRNFSSDPFLGGVALNDTTALFSMMLSDRAFDTKFKARKSVFIIGNTVYCVGSNIYNEDATHATETALFQNVYASGMEQVKVNGNVVSTNQTNLSKPVITDNYGNTYKIFSTGTVNVELNNTLATAYINHGTAPANTVYQYGIIFGGGDEAVLDGIEVKQRDANAHYLYEPQTQTTALAIFSAGDNLNYGWVKRVNSPSLVVLKENETAIELVFSDPDMRQLTAANIDDMSSATAAAAGNTFNYELELSGLFYLSTGSEGVQVVRGNASTTIKATVSEGKSYRLLLSKSASGISNIASGEHRFSYMRAEGGYQINSSSASLPFDYALWDISGRKMIQKTQRYQQDFFPVNGLPQGMYILQVQDNQQQQAWKIYN